MVFFNLTEAETTDELTALSMKLAPTLAEHEDNISLNQELFKKIDAVYNQKDALGLTREQQRLLEKTYKGFVRSGANLPADKQARLREINKQLSTLGITFSNNILNENNDFKLYVEKEEDLAGLPQWFRESALVEARATEQQGNWSVSPCTMQAACLSCNIQPTARCASRCTKPTSTVATTMTRTTTKKSLPTS